MKITIVDFTRNAAEMLIFSKRTRLNMDMSSYNSLFDMTEAEKNEELDYVFNTIGSSWEFVDYTFMIQDVTRAFTHQLVRHRVGVSFAQQSQRTVDMSGFNYLASGRTEESDLYHRTMKTIQHAYEMLIEQDVPPEDARGILPTNVLTNILMKINLRSLSDMMKTRLCERSQGEFRLAAEKMKALVVGMHPWAEKILVANCDRTGVCQFPNFKDCPRKKVV